MNKHFLLGAGFALVITFSASSVFAQSLAILSPSSTFSCLALGGKIVTQSECSAANAGTVRWCAPGETPQTGTTGGATCKVDSSFPPACAAGQIPAPGAECIPSGLGDLTQQPAQQNPQPSTSQPVQPATTPTQSDSSASDSKKIIEEIKQKQKQDEEQDETFKRLQEIIKQTQQPEEEIQVPEQQSKKINKSRVSSTRNPAVTLAKKGSQNVDKLLNTLSKKFKKERNKNKKLAVVRSVAKDFMKLCTKYAPSIQDEEFGDEESFTCDEFVAEISEPIASALKSKDADLAYEATYDALDINFRELFDSLTQQ